MRERRQDRKETSAGVFGSCIGRLRLRNELQQRVATFRASGSSGLADKTVAGRALGVELAGVLQRWRYYDKRYAEAEQSSSTSQDLPQYYSALTNRAGELLPSVLQVGNREQGCCCSGIFPQQNHA